MYISLAYFLTLSTVLSSQALAATPTLTPGGDAIALTALTAGLHNSSLNIPQPPEDFDLTFEIGGPKLRITSCLMNAVAALRELALGDWDLKITDGTEFRLDSYPEVSIIITTAKRKRNVQARFVTWAVCLGLFEMIALNRFEFAQIEMSWQRQIIGWVQVVNHPPRTSTILDETLGLVNDTLALPNIKHATGSEPVNITNIVTTDNANDAAEARLSVDFAPYGNFLSIYDVFVPIMSGLTDMAMISSDRESSALMIGVNGFKGFVCVLPALPLRTSPPTLTYGWLIRAISRIPTYMLAEGRFGEVTMKLMVDNVAVGYGRLSTAPNCNDDGVFRGPLGLTES